VFVGVEDRNVLTLAEKEEKKSADFGNWAFQLRLSHCCFVELGTSEI
jgi:hypothetical protein